MLPSAWLSQAGSLRWPVDRKCMGGPAGARGGDRRACDRQPGVPPARPRTSARVHRRRRCRRRLRIAAPARAPWHAFCRRREDRCSATSSNAQDELTFAVLLSHELVFVRGRKLPRRCAGDALRRAAPGGTPWSAGAPSMCCQIASSRNGVSSASMRRQARARRARWAVPGPRSNCLWPERESSSHLSASELSQSERAYDRSRRCPTPAVRSPLVTAHRASSVPSRATSSAVERSGLRSASWPARRG